MEIRGGYILLTVDWNEVHVCCILTSDDSLEWTVLQ